MLCDQYAVPGWQDLRNVEANITIALQILLQIQIITLSYKYTLIVGRLVQ